MTPTDLAPPAHLCDLVDAAVCANLDEQAMAVLDAAVDADAVGQEEMAIMALLAPVVAQHRGDHPFLGRMTGIRRRARLTHGAAEYVAETTLRVAPGGVVLGDLGAARALYADPVNRWARLTVLAMPSVTRERAHQIARQVSNETGVSVRGGRWPVLEHLGARVLIHRSLGTAFDFPRFRRAIRPSVELQVYDCLVRSATAGPRITWYADVVAAGSRLDWDQLWNVGRLAGWSAPVAGAAEVLLARGWDVPTFHPHDALVDRACFEASRMPVSRRGWLVARLARRALPG